MIANPKNVIEDFYRANSREMQSTVNRLLREEPIDTDERLKPLWINNAEDIISETYIVLFQKRGFLMNMSPQGMRAYAFKTLLYLTKNNIRNEKQRQRHVRRLVENGGRPRRRSLKANNPGGPQSMGILPGIVEPDYSHVGYSQVLDNRAAGRQFLW